MIPIYKIEVWEPGAESALYSITDDAFNIHTKQTATDNIGIFSFYLPTVKGVTSEGYLYTDIEVYDTVKIWFGWQDEGGLPINPTFVGKIYQISTPLNISTGYVRAFSGKCNGEILKRHLKRQKKWTDTDASDIVTELANDLSLGTGEIASDTTDVTLTVECESYFDVLRKVSDYWYDADHQVKKDFWVDNSNNLCWKSRPVRTSGVSALTIGQNIQSYNVTRPLEPVRNKIYVYGDQRKEPTDGDLWTESGGSWGGGPTYSWQEDAKVGTYSKQGTKTSTLILDAWLTFDQIDCTARFKNDFDRFHTWIKVQANPNPEGELSIMLCLSHTNTMNSYYYVLNAAARPTMTQDGIWYEFDLPLGPDRGYWSTMGSPSWDNITAARFYCSGLNSGTITVRWDELYFYGRHYLATVEDATSQTNYGIREMEYLDTNIKSDSDCTKRGEALLYQLKNPVTRLDILLGKGDTNVLVGDRIPITIPAEGFSSTNFDVVSVEQFFNENGFSTGTTMVNTADTRTPAPITERDIIRQNIIGPLRSLAQGVRTVK